MCGLEGTAVPILGILLCVAVVIMAVGLSKREEGQGGVEGHDSDA